MFSLFFLLNVISGKRYDEKVDIFSFGIVLCEVRTADLTLRGAAEEPVPSCSSCVHPASSL